MIAGIVMDAWFGMWRISSAASAGIAPIFPRYIRSGRTNGQLLPVIRDRLLRSRW
jgi:hypothetical protein